MAHYATDLNAYRRRRAEAGSKKTLGKSGVATTARLPAFVKPQLATLVDRVPTGKEWLHEIKLDGYRILCRIDHGRITLLTRRAQDWTERFKSVAIATKRLRVEEAFLDGEVVALDEEGRSNFQRLQNVMKGSGSSQVIYFAFDLLHVDGRDLRNTPLEQRKKLLQELLEHGGPDEKGLRYSPHWIGKGEALYRECCRRNLEGIISKRGDRPYRSDRGRDWVKIKCVQRQEFVIGGFTEPAGSRTGLGALLLGVYEEGGSLAYAGRVGTGFTVAGLRELRTRLNDLSRPTSPFVNSPKGREGSGVHWVEPKLIAEVAFSEWTGDNFLRHPSFQGLREDKKPGDISRERPVPMQNREKKRFSPKGHAKNFGARAGENRTIEGTEIAGIRITHPDRVLYPEQNITKRALAAYYEQIGDWILPHLEKRPLTLVRCPQGRSKHCFYQRHVGEPADKAIHRFSVKEGQAASEYVWIDSVEGLITLVQMGVLEIHTWGSRIERLDEADRLIFDLDPDGAIPWSTIRQAAQTVGDRLKSIGLVPFIKTTGGKGLHIVAPITPKQEWGFVKEFSKKVAQSIVHSAPERYTAVMSKAKRKGKIFIDYLRNSKTATTVCAYSTRALAGAPVSVPLRWDELSRDLRTEFDVKHVPERLARLKEDPWKEYEAARVVLTKSMMAQL